MSNTYTQKQIDALIAAKIDLNEFFGATVRTAPAKPAKKDGRNHAARKHNHDARMTRRADSGRKGGAGMTKAEKSALYAELRSDLGRVPTKTEWNRACKKARGL